MTWCLLLALATAAADAQPRWWGEPPKAAERVVSLAPSATELIYALSRGDRLVGVTRFADHPPSVAALPRVGGFVDPNVEAIASLEPDMVVALPTSGGPQRLRPLQRLEIPVLVLPNNSLAGLFASIETLGAHLDARAAAETLAVHLRGRFSGLQKRSQRRESLPVLVALGQRPLVAAGPESFVNELLQLLNARNVVTRGGAYPRLGLETVARLAPRIIVDLSMGTGRRRGLWGTDGVLQTIGARLVRFDSDALLRMGPRLADGLARLERVLRPAARAAKRTGSQ